jgi:hypothetical protein
MGQQHMENAGFCHAMARDCERAAQAALTVDLRKQLLDQAATWWRLAGEPPGYGDVPLAPGDGGDGGFVDRAFAAGHGARRHA